MFVMGMVLLSRCGGPRKGAESCAKPGMQENGESRSLLVYLPTDVD